MNDPMCRCGHSIEDHGGSDQDPCDECDCVEFSDEEDG